MPRIREVAERLHEIPHLKTNAAIYLGLTALGRVRNFKGSRGLLPEPFDFFNHNGNILSSVTTGIVAAGVVKLATPENMRYRRTAMMGAALLGGVAVNALVETKQGLELPIVPKLFRGSTPDPLDFAYGMVGAAIGGAMVVSSENN